MIITERALGKGDREELVRRGVPAEELDRRGIAKDLLRTMQEAEHGRGGRTEGEKIGVGAVAAQGIDVDSSPFSEARFNGVKF